MEQMPPNIHLYIVDAEFPNATMNSNWYRGHYTVTEIVIRNCHLHTVTPDAFDSLPFRTMTLVEFVGLKQFEFNYQPCEGQSILQFYFWHTEFRLLENRLFSPIKQDLVVLFIQYMPDDTNWFHLFNNERFSNLHYLDLTGVGQNAARSLDRTSLPRAPRISLLFLNRCGIEYIHPNTFHYTGESLRHLGLNDNKLKTVSIDLFSTFIDVSIWREYKRKYLEINDHQLDFSCEFYEFDFMMYFSLNITVLFKYESGMADIQCDNVQTISKRKFHVNGEPDIFGFSKVNIRISDGLLSAPTKFTAKFRLLIINHRPNQFQKNAKCPTFGWIRSSVKCFLLAGNNKIISIEEFVQKNELTTFGVILTMIHKRMWPMHLITYRRSAGDRDETSVCAIAIILTASCCAGLLLAVISTIPYWKCIKRERASLEANRMR